MSTHQIMHTYPEKVVARTQCERPILFSGAMVRSILDDLKTQTRRLMKPQPQTAQMISEDTASLCYPGMVWRHSPYGTPGDRLIVKEASWIWCEKRRDGLTKTGRPKFRYIPVGQQVVYCAHQAKPTKALDQDPTHCWRWKSGRFMPRWASRITLELTAVRVERVQEITYRDCEAEGLEHVHRGWWVNPYADDVPGSGAEEGFLCYRKLWDSLNAKCGRGWDTNPWVWVLTFKRL